ncbi:MAG: 30S ribosomal protein S9 [Candidatus Methylomirabilales bacterium]
MKATATFTGTGRRKSAVARVRLQAGAGQISINRRLPEHYFGRAVLRMIISQPLKLAGIEGKYDVIVNVKGGGPSGQAGAIRHGLSRALLNLNEEFRPALKRAGFLTRDPRVKERKKYGQRGARARFQFSKR